MGMISKLSRKNEGAAVKENFIAACRQLFKRKRRKGGKVEKNTKNGA
jgi:hypothetical protein